MKEVGVTKEEFEKVKRSDRIVALSRTSVKEKVSLEEVKDKLEKRKKEIPSFTPSKRGKTKEVKRKIIDVGSEEESNRN